MQTKRAGLESAPHPWLPAVGFLAPSVSEQISCTPARSSLELGLCLSILLSNPANAQSGTSPVGSQGDLVPFGPPSESTHGPRVQESSDSPAILFSIVCHVNSILMLMKSLGGSLLSSGALCPHSHHHLLLLQAEDCTGPMYPVWVKPIPWEEGRMQAHPLFPEKS